MPGAGLLLAPAPPRLPRSGPARPHRRARRPPVASGRRLHRLPPPHTRPLSPRARPDPSRQRRRAGGIQGQDAARPLNTPTHRHACAGRSPVSSRPFPDPAPPGPGWWPSSALCTRTRTARFACCAACGCTSAQICGTSWSTPAGFAAAHAAGFRCGPTCSTRPCRPASAHAARPIRPLGATAASPWHRTSLEDEVLWELSHLSRISGHLTTKQPRTRTLSAR